MAVNIPTPDAEEIAQEYFTVRRLLESGDIGGVIEHLGQQVVSAVERIEQSVQHAKDLIQIEELEEDRKEFVNTCVLACNQKIEAYDKLCRFFYEPDGAMLKGQEVSAALSDFYQQMGDSTMRLLLADIGLTVKHLRYANLTPEQRTYFLEQERTLNNLRQRLDGIPLDELLDLKQRFRDMEALCKFNVTPKDLARRVGCSEDTVCRYLERMARVDQISPKPKNKHWNLSREEGERAYEYIKTKLEKLHKK